MYLYNEKSTDLSVAPVKTLCVLMASVCMGVYVGIVTNFLIDVRLSSSRGFSHYRRSLLTHLPPLVILSVAVVCKVRGSTGGAEDVQ